jgi:hypothetical protein
MNVLWNIAPGSHVEIGRRFTRVYCFHHQGDGPEDGGSEHTRNLGSVSEKLHDVIV